MGWEEKEEPLVFGREQALYASFLLRQQCTACVLNIQSWFSIQFEVVQLMFVIFSKQPRRRRHEWNSRHPVSTHQRADDFKFKVNIYPHTAAARNIDS